MSDGMCDMHKDKEQAMPAITERQKEILRNTLGNDKMYRDVYVSGPECASHDDVCALVDAGLMRRYKEMPNNLFAFITTDAGKEVAFPKAMPANDGLREKELKPCPHYGGEARIGGIRMCQVSCAAGAVCMPIAAPDDPQHAVNRWNSRPIEDHLRTVIAGQVDVINGLDRLVDKACDHIYQANHPRAASDIQAARKELMRDV